MVHIAKFSTIFLIAFVDFMHLNSQLVEIVMTATQWWFFQVIWHAWLCMMNTLKSLPSWVQRKNQGRILEVTIHLYRTWSLKDTRTMIIAFYKVLRLKSEVRLFWLLHIMAQWHHQIRSIRSTARLCNRTTSQNPWSCKDGAQILQKQLVFITRNYWWKSTTYLIPFCGKLPACKIYLPS